MKGGMRTAGGWLCLLLLGLAGRAEAQDQRATVIVKGNLTTSSQLFPHPDAPDPVMRAESFPLTGIFGGGIELRYRFPESNIALGISADMISASSSNPIFLNTGMAVPVDDGYFVVPVELTGYFIIPASGPTFGLFMGGGAGMYFGHRTYQMAGVEAATIGRRAGYGIHVLGGVSYRFTDRFSLTAEMKFRDVQFTSTNAFSIPNVMYNGVSVGLPSGPFDSQVHTDGMVLQLGAAIDL